MNNFKIIKPHRSVPGGIPPHIAGREKEISTIRRCIEELLTKTNIKGQLTQQLTVPPQIFIGPGGMGKTTLLSIAIKYASQKKLKYEFVGLRHFYCPDNLEDNLLGFEKRLLKIVSKKPILLLIDEAHTIDTVALRQIINLIQKFQNQKYPINALFAGSQSLKAKLMLSNNSDTIYNHVFIKSLDINETKLALKKPAKKNNIVLSEEVLNMLATNTENYPYFIQLLGAEVYQILERKNTNVCSYEIAKKAIDNFNIQKFWYFRMLDDRIIDTFYENEGLRLIRYIKRNKSTNRKQLIKYLKSQYSQYKAKKIFQKFYDIGFIYETNNCIKPAMPSYFTYFEKEYGTEKVIKY